MVLRILRKSRAILWFFARPVSSRSVPPPVATPTPSPEQQLANCSSIPEPILVPFGDVPLAAEDSAPARPTAFGLQTRVGKQNMALYINPQEADLYVTIAKRDCKGIRNGAEIPAMCPLIRSFMPGYEVLSGGLFDPDQSGTVEMADDNADIYTIGSDSITIGNITLPNFTLRQWPKYKYYSDPNVTQVAVESAYVGLNSSSSLLQSLCSDNALPSRSWSFFGGRVNASRDSYTQLPVPGSLCLGCYDRSKISEPFSEFNISDEGCPFAVEVQGISWTGRSDLNASRPFIACISPQTNRFELPRAEWQTLNKRPASAKEYIIDQGGDYEPITINPISPIGLTGAGLNQYQVDRTPLMMKNNGQFLSLTINGMKSDLEIPAQQLIQRRREINVEGFTVPLQSRDTDYPEFMFTVAQAAEGARPTFGLPFFSAVYLMVNYENSTFNLAQTPTIIPSTSDIVSIKHPTCYSASAVKPPDRSHPGKVITIPRSFTVR